MAAFACKWRALEPRINQNHVLIFHAAIHQHIQKNLVVGVIFLDMMCMGDFNQFDEDDDEFVGNAWTNGWLRHYCAGGPTPGKMAEWFRYCKMAAGADQMEEEDEWAVDVLRVSVARLPHPLYTRHPNMFKRTICGWTMMNLLEVGRLRRSNP